MQNSKSKLLKCIIICLSLVIIFTCDKISAKNVAMDCEYNFVKDSLAGFGGGKVKCTIYTDNSHVCILDPDGVKNQKYASNWGSKVADFDAKSYYKKYRQCPPIMVYYNDPNLPDQIFFADSTTTANNIKNAQKNSSNCYLSADTTDENAKKQYAEKISSHTSYIKKQASSYSLDNCIEKENTITRVANCSNQIDALRMYITSAESEVNSWISAGYASNEDDVVKEFKKAIEDAKKTIESANKEIDNEREKIKKELGLENDYKEENTTSGDIGEKTSGCGIFGENTLSFIKKIYKFLQFIIPVIVIIFGMLDFIKALGTGEEKEFKKAGSNFAKRVIIGVCFFLIPAILSLFIRISGITSQYDINDGVKSIFCILE